MDWPVQVVSSWGEFTESVDRLALVTKPPDTSYMFRGQANKNCTLEPSLTRLLPGATAAEACQLERELWHEFRAQATGHIPSGYFFGVQEDVLGWWCLMQHYRAPTRVLDWTSSPYVAAYFSVEDHWSTDAAIWVLNTGSLAMEMEAKYPGFHISKIDDIEKLLDSGAPPHLSGFRRLRTTERMVAQQGYFTICRLPTFDHAQIIAEHLKSRQQTEAA